MATNRDARPFADDDFEQLISDAKAGSGEALGRLVESCRPYLMLIANQDLDPKLRAKLGASDVVQETLVAAQHGIGGFRGTTEKDLLAWLRGILLNDLLQNRRKFRGTDKRQVDRELPLGGDSRHDKPPIDLASQQHTPGTEAVLREQAEELGRVMSRLPEDYQMVVRLRNWEQLSFEEIGTKMQRSAEAVRKLWARAIAQLQQELDGDA